MPLKHQIPFSQKGVMSQNLQTVHDGNNTSMKKQLL